MKTLVASTFETLFKAFDFLEQGESVLLMKSTETVHTPQNAQETKSRLGLYSSGTLGTSKIIWKDWKTLHDQVHPSTRSHTLRWATSFAPWTFAGVHVGLHAWKQNLSVFQLPPNWAETIQQLNQHNITAISSTPTFLDLLGCFLQSRQPSGFQESFGSRIQHISLGGESLRPDQGMRFRTWFPNCRFTIYYATSELGVILKTNRLDGWFELDGFQRTGIDWKIQEGTLWIEQRPEWHSTHDLAEIDDTRRLIRFVGRDDRVANVAGTKIRLDEISHLAESVDGIHRATAFSEANAITGEIIGLNYEITLGQDWNQVEERLKYQMRSSLPKVAWPRQWNRCRSSLGPNGKAKLNSVFEPATA